MTDRNPYLTETLRYPCRCEWKMGFGLGCTLCAGPIGGPEWEERLGMRNRLVRQYAYAIPDDAAIAALAALSPLIEIGAGTGYWAHLAASSGADIIAFDVKPGYNNWCKHDSYHPVEVGGPTRATEHPDRTLFLCWPPMTAMAAQTLRRYHGTRLVYVGEDAGGCCATDAFFRQLDRYWRQVTELDIPQWWGIHDVLWVFERKGKR